MIFIFISIYFALYMNNVNTSTFQHLNISIQNQMKNIFYLLIVLTVFITSCGEDTPVTPDLPEITVANTTVAETDNDKTVSIILTLDKATDGNIIFNYSTIAGTASSGIDFTGAADEIFIINSGSTTANLDIVIKGDDVDENNETFEIVFLNPIGGTFSQSKITVTITDDDEDGGVVIPTTGYITPLTYPGYTLTWQDEFDGSTLGSHWNFEVNGDGGGNNELQFYRTENTSLVEGNLVIEAKQEGYGGRNYTSSRLTTQGTKSFTYGRIDMRAILPEGQGIWPALWMLGDNISTEGWPACGEIDIMELVGHQPNRVHGTIHWRAEDNNNIHAQFGTSTALSSGKFSDEFHVFSIIWDANQIQWYMDDVLYNTADITPASLSEFHNNFFFIFNVAVGGNWPGSPDATTSFPQRMIVDYVRVFQ
jgi:hypothetical protein